MNGLRLALELVGVAMLYTGWFDAYKYHISANKIREVKTGRGHSRRFINWALVNDLVKLTYLLLSALAFNRVDWFLIICTFFALIFMIEHWICLYLYYPYKLRGVYNFKRPNVWKYLVNSVQSNNNRKRL